MSLELHDPAVVNDQLDGSAADGPERLPELPEECLRQRGVVWPGWLSRRECRKLAHDPI